MTITSRKYFKNKQKYTRKTTLPKKIGGGVEIIPDETYYQSYNFTPFLI